MSTPSENAFDTIQQDSKYNEKYIDRFVIGKDKVNPLQNVVPIKCDDFFGTKVCNIICITGPYTDWDDDKLTETLDRLRAIYSIFAKYETHFIFDKEADEYAKLSSTTKNKMKSDYQQLANDGSAYGLYYWGELSSASLYQKVTELINTFFGLT